MIKTSEYCALGHPDRTCDYIESYILDRYLELGLRSPGFADRCAKGLFGYE